MRKFGIAILLIVSLVLLAACGNEEASGEPLDVAACSQELLAAGVFTDELTQVETEVAIEYYGITQADVKDAHVYLSTGATAEELAIFTAKDTETAKNIAAGVQQRISNQKTAFEQYLPAEITKLDAAYVLEVSQGGEEYMILCIADNIDEAKTIIAKYIAN